jgi:hypothetical protein
VTVTATDPIASEAGLVPGAITFSRTSHDTTAPLNVFFSRGGDAGDGSDYETLGGTVTFATIPAGELSVSVAIVPRADNVVEPPETVIVTIEASSTYIIGTPDTATVTIEDDPPIVNIAAADGDASEAGADPGAMTLSRTGGNLAAALTVRLAIGGTASNNIDYALVSGLVDIPAGQHELQIVIAPDADNDVEGAEAVVMTIEPRSNYLVGPSASASVTIADDPPRVAVTATDPDASEAGPDPGVFTFSRSGGDLGSSLAVFFSKAGTATNGIDYASLGGAVVLVSIPAGQPSTTVTVTPLADPLVEGPETVILTIQPRSTYVIVAPGSATVTIADVP